MARSCWATFPIVAFLMSCWPGSAPAQKTEGDFHQMLESMYQHSVPLLKADSSTITDLSAYTVLDTRELSEYQVSHLPGAIYVGYDDFSKTSVEALPRDKPVIVYCSIGYRSERIGKRLLKMGFTDVQNLYGGIFWWKYLSLPVLDANEAPTERVHTYNARWGKWLLRGESVY